MNWYVAQVITGKEEMIRQRIEDQNIKAIVPLRIMMERKKGTWCQVKRTAFPGYVFILSTIFNANMYYTIKSLPGVIRLLGDAKGPAPVREEEITLLLKWARNGDPLGLSKVFIEGTKVTVVDGPLKGYEGKIKKLDARRFRAKVDINFFGDSKIVEFAVNVIKKSDA